MPAFDIDSQSPGGSFEPQPSDGWSMPLGRLAGIRFYVSYSVFVALAVLAGLVAMLCNVEGNQDLPLIAVMSVLIWLIGWSVQVIVHVSLHLGTAARSETITVGLLGIEAPNPLVRQYPWSAVSNLAAACFSLTALVLFGAASLAIHLLTMGLDVASGTAWLTELSKPSFGLDAVENGYLTATWLFWIQAACQAYPLPRNMGRGAIASAVALFTSEASDEFQIKLFRRMLQFAAIITLLIATATMIADASLFLPRWPILGLLSLFLWFSTRKPDIRDWITSVHLANADPVARPLFWETTAVSTKMVSAPPSGRPRRRGTQVNQWIDSLRMQGKRRRAKAAWKRERAEADDAARLDEVLRRVSELGADGLSAEDKSLLQRVSASLRENRRPAKGDEADSSDPSPS